MSVNIFGASKIITRGDGKKGERGIGFNLDSYDNFDIDGKRLVNVAEPYDGNDAATKVYVDRIREELNDDLTDENNSLSARVNDVEDKIEDITSDISEVRGDVSSV